MQDDVNTKAICIDIKKETDKRTNSEIKSMIGVLIFKDKWETIQTNEIDVMLQEFKLNWSNNDNDSEKNQQDL